MTVNDHGELRQGRRRGGRAACGADHAGAGGGGDVQGGAADAGRLVGRGPGQIGQVEPVRGEELLGQCGRVAAVGRAPFVAGALDEQAAARRRCAGYVDQRSWERFHAGWPILPHPFSGFRVNMTDACSIPCARPWYCASLVM
nr:hypothetical protein [Micromonospora sp. 4G55]